MQRFARSAFAYIVITKQSANRIIMFLKPRAYSDNNQNRHVPRALDKTRLQRRISRNNEQMRSNNVKVMSKIELHRIFVSEIITLHIFILQLNGHFNSDFYWSNFEYDEVSNYICITKQLLSWKLNYFAMY